MNQTGDLRLLDAWDSVSKDQQYFQKMRKSNRTCHARNLSGMSTPTDLVCLQVKGKNQLFKEIEETQRI